MKRTNINLESSMGTRRKPTFADPTGWDSEARDRHPPATMSSRIGVALAIVAGVALAATILVRYTRITVASSPAFTGQQVIKEMTFEGGLTDQTTGADKVNKGVGLERDTPLKGLYSARVSGGSAYFEQPFPETGDLYASFYVRMAALPADGDVRLVRLSNGRTTVGNLLLTEGRLRLRVDSTPLGPDSKPLIAGHVYRVGVHQQVGNGSTAVLEGFLAEGDAPFGAPFAATTSGSWTVGADRIRLGSTTRVGIDAIIDDARLSLARMPDPSDK